MKRVLLIFWLGLCCGDLTAQPQEPPRPGDRMIADYFQRETKRLAERCLDDIQSEADWARKKGQYRRELLEMLGLQPLPARTDLKATVTATTDHEQFTVQRLHFQSRPGLYVTANLYSPKQAAGKLPAILYVCGHGRVAKDGVSYGNKAHYQHHGAWFARNGYVCLTIDTLQLGEIEGIHHGTYREKMWWWLNRGYTPAGVEAWNCVRALDYLQSLDQVDPERLGVTGRSGGGAYSWWIAAIDERIKCAVPVAGITDLTNHVVRGMPGRFHDGCVEGHCDCMFMLNTYQWDYPLLAALVSPRPLLISNTDTDAIFPLDGVYRTFEKARRVYGLQDAADKVALQITAGGHQDTQELRVHAFRWFNKHLKGDQSLIETTAVKFFEPEQLRVFDELPKDQRNTTIQETFVPSATPSLPTSDEHWTTLRTSWMKALDEKSFAGWPKEPAVVTLRQSHLSAQHGLIFRQFDFHSQGGIPLSLFVVHSENLKQASSVQLEVLDATSWNRFVESFSIPFGISKSGQVLQSGELDSLPKQLRSVAAEQSVQVFVAPRGIGPTAWDPSERKQTQHRRRFYLLGQTLDGMRVWDVRRAIQATRHVPLVGDAPLRLVGRDGMAGVALYASLYEPNIASVQLDGLAPSHRHGPFFLNVRRFFDIPQAVAMAAEKHVVELSGSDSADWQYPLAVVEKLGWSPKRLEIRARQADAE